MCDSVPYFVVVRYRNYKFTKRRRFSCYDDAYMFVLKTVIHYRECYAVMPQEVVMQIVDDCDGLPY